MTVETSVNVVSYVGNGVTTVFPYTFTVLDADHMQVYEQVIATGALTLISSANYLVSGIPGTGNVTYNPSGIPVPSTKRVVIYRVVPYTQELDIENQGGFFANTLEDQLDLTTMQIQQLKEILDRALVRPLGAAIIAEDHFWKADGNGNAVDGGSAEDIENAQAYAAEVAVMYTELLGITGLAPFDTYTDQLETRTFPLTQKAIKTQGYVNDTPGPAEGRWKYRASAPSVTKPWHKQAANGNWYELADHILHPHMFGNVGTGGDDTQAFQDMFDCLCRAPTDLISGQVIVPAGNYEVDELVIGNFPAGAQWRHFNISGYGAVMKPRSGGTASGTMFTVLPGGVKALYQIEGFAINHRSTHNHLQAFDLNGAIDTSLRHMYISGGGRAGTYYGIHLDQTDQANQDTGAFWCNIDDVWIRKDAANAIAYGIVSRGANNALTVHDCKITTGTGTAVLLQTATGIAYTANGFRFLNNKVEGNTYGVHYAIAPSQRPFGFQSFGNRFESTDYPHRFTLDSGSLAAVQNGKPVIGPNTYLSFTSVLLNTAGVDIDFRDCANGSGSVTIANGNTTAAVTFNTTEYNATYGVSLSGADASLFPSSPATSGFTVNRAGTTGDLVVRWRLQPNVN